MLDNNVNNKQQLLQFRALSPQQAAQQQVAMQAVNPELLKEMFRIVMLQTELEKQLKILRE